MTFVKESPRVRFVLANPSHPGNIGATARAMQTMGFTELWVVNPLDRDYRQNAEARAFATHSVNVLDSSRSVDTLEEALIGVTRAYALTGYDREFGPELRDISYCCKEAYSHLQEFPSSQIAFVFGTERSGLSNQEIALCQMCAAIPANPECDSLNLSQAVQVVAYQAQMTFRGEGVDQHAHRFTEEIPAEVEARERFFEHLEEAMISCGALNPERPKNMMQRLRRLFTKAEPSQQDIDLLRGICSAIICPKIDRMGRKTDKISRK